MKVIFNIARAELRLLFYSPIAWLLLVCFAVQSGLIFTRLLEPMVYGMQDYGAVRFASSFLFVANNGTLWNQMANYLYFYIPLLTMGCVSRDLGSGSIKLFYSSPVSNLQIVLGKYVALVYYALILTGILALYVVLSWCTIEHFEAAWIWTGWFGLFLLACAYMAIGLFMSSLTSYQILSAVGTFTVFVLLSLVRGWGQQYDWVRDVTYWLGIDGRVDTFLRGVLCSEDVIYFLTVIGMFLAFTVIRLRAIRQKQRWYVTGAKNIGVLVVVSVIAILSSTPALMGYCDTTSTGKNTLAPQSQKILEKLDGGVTITAYVNVLDPSYISYSYPGFIKGNQEFFQQYVRFKPEMKIKTVYYYAEPNPDSLAADPTGKKAWAKARGVCEVNEIDSTMLKTREEVEREADLAQEGYLFAWQIERENGQKAWLRPYQRGSAKMPGESEISIALKRMVDTLPRIGFVTGHGERSMDEESTRSYYYIMGDKRTKYSVWNLGVDVEEIGLDAPVPAGVDIVMISDPTTPFTPAEEEVLQDYVDRGGNLFILGEPRNREALNPTLRRLLGVELTPMLAQYDARFKALRPDELAVISNNVGYDEMFSLGRSCILGMPTVSGIEVVEDKGFEPMTVLKTDTLSAVWTELETVDFADDSVVFHPEAGEVSKTFTTVLGLSRNVDGKEQRILLSGDADVLSNEMFLRRSRVTFGNDKLMEGACWWLSYGETPVDLRKPLALDNTLHMSLTSYKVVKWFFCGILPVCMALMYIFLWLRRRGR